MLLTFPVNSLELFLEVRPMPGMIVAAAGDTLLSREHLGPEGSGCCPRLGHRPFMFVPCFRSSQSALNREGRYDEDKHTDEPPRAWYPGVHLVVPSLIERPDPSTSQPSPNTH